MDTPPNPKITISGFDIEWDLKQGVNLWAGVPTLSMWIPTTVAGLMAGMQAMVGTERFNLCMQVGGQQSVDGDWSIISSKPTLEEGMQAMSEIAWPAGWGRWTLVSIDRGKKEAAFRAHNSWEGIYQRSLGVCWGSGMLAGKFAGIASRVFGVECWAEQTHFTARGDEFDEFVVRESNISLNARLEQLLAQGKATSSDLAIALERLRREAEERERTAAELREKLEVISRQEETLRTMAMPIVQVWDGVIMVPIMGSLDSGRAEIMMQRLLQELVSSRARYAILDLTAVDTVDTNTADHLVRIVSAIELLGARSVITGIRPAVAQTMVSLGVDLSHMTTLRNLQEGLHACIRWSQDGAKR
jgi:rsbT co-antagonist protein RsbR